MYDKRSGIAVTDVSASVFFPSLSLHQNQGKGGTEDSKLYKGIFRQATNSGPAMVDKVLVARMRKQR